MELHVTTFVCFRTRHLRFRCYSNLMLYVARASRSPAIAFALSSQLLLSFAPRSLMQDKLDSLLGPVYKHDVRIHAASLALHEL